MIEDGKIPQPLITTLRKLGSGYINGTRVILGAHAQFKPTSCVTELAFLGDIEAGRPERLRPDVVQYLETQLGSGAVREDFNYFVKFAITYSTFLKVGKKHKSHTVEVFLQRRSPGKGRG